MSGFSMVNTTNDGRRGRPANWREYGEAQTFEIANAKGTLVGTVVIEAEGTAVVLAVEPVSGKKSRTKLAPTKAKAKAPKATAQPVAA